MRPTVTLDEALVRSADLFEGWINDETVDEDELETGMASQIVDLAADLRQPVTDKLATLRKVEAFFVEHYGSHVIEMPSDELGFGPIAMTWRTVRTALRDAT